MNKQADGAGLFLAVLSAFTWLHTVLVAIVCSLLGVIIFYPLGFFLDRKRSWMHGLSRWWAKFAVYCTPLSNLKVEGLENIRAGQHYVIVANHQSLLDILLVLAALPVHYKFMAKKELFVWPFIGWHMSLTGYIPIDRADPEGRKTAFLKAQKALERGVSVLFFPEGTRSPDGEIHHFKMGAFKAAKEAGVPLLPVVIDGTWDAVPKHSWKLRKKVAFVVSVGKPVEFNAGTRLDTAVPALRQEMAGRLHEIRGRAK